MQITYSCFERVKTLNKDNYIRNIDNKGNKLIGTTPLMSNTEIRFNGCNNVLFCEEQVTLVDSKLEFEGDNALIYIGKGEHRLWVSINSNSVFHCGQYSMQTNTMCIIVAEQKHCFIGDSCLFSSDIVIRNCDAHLIYCCNDGKRINQSESVFIGDHVWIGQQATILKGTKIDSGCIVGANSLLPSKKVSHNCMWGGNPARQLKSDVFWDKTLTYGFDEKMTRLSENYSKFLDEYREDCCKDYWIYQYNEEQEIKWEKLDRILSRGSVMGKCSTLYELNKKKVKNRFVHK